MNHRDALLLVVRGGLYGNVIRCQSFFWGGRGGAQLI